MSAPQFDPVQEKAELSRAIGALLHCWGKPDMAQAVATLRAALAQAEHALAALEQEPERDTAFAVHVLGHCQLNGSQPDMTTIYCGHDFF
jgi:hypothetical protein